MCDYKLCQQRMELFADNETFWGKHRSELANLEPVMDFPNEAYHNIPGADVDFRAMLLTRPYLNRLRLQLVRLHRQGKSVTQYVDDYWRKKNDAKLLNHVNFHRKKHGFSPIEKVGQ